MTPRLETWAVLADREARRGRPDKYFDADFPLGEIEPVAANTGSRVTGTNYAGDIRNVTRGEVISGLNITGVVRPDNPGIMRDCRILGGPAPEYGNSHTLVDVRHSNIDVPFRFEFVSLEPSDRSVDIYGFEYGGIDAYRCSIVGTVDAASVHGIGSWPNTIHRVVKFHACRFDDSPFYAVDPRQTDGSHNDFIQAHGSLSLLEVIGCSFGKLGPRAMACILLQQHHGLYSGPIKITDNWFYGHQSKGAVFNMSETRDEPFSDLSFHRNRIWRDSNHASPSPIAVKSRSRIPANFGMTGTNGSLPSTWTPGPNVNVYMDNGAHVQPKAG